MSRVPRIRFKGFEEDWEQRKLSEIALRVSNLRLSSSDLPCVEYEDVVSEAGILNNDIRSKKVVKAGILFDDTHVLYGKLRPYLHNWLCPDFSGVAVGDWWVLKPCYVAREFIYRIIQTKRFDNATNQSSGSKMPRADWNLVSNTEFMISSDSSEQEKIGLYFKKLDHLITLHQRKLEKLKIIKKSMLENLFPQNGEKTSKIRFSGFTKDWEQRKLGEIIQERNIRTSDFDRFPIFSLTIESGITPKTERYERSSLVTKTEDLFKVVKPNEFVTNPMNLRFGALGYNAQKYDVSVSGYYDVFSIDGNNCSGFWNAYFKTHHIMNVFDNVATGSLVEKKRVKYSTLKQIYLSVPTNMEEKNKISKIMILTDHLITLHQSKLDKLRKIKKSILESMFV